MYITRASLYFDLIPLRTMWEITAYDDYRILLLFSTATMLSGFSVYTTINIMTFLCPFYFVGSKVLLCDFHREKAWLEWTSKSDNGVASIKETILDLLGRVAHAVTIEDSVAAIRNLQNIKFGNDNEKLREWFWKKWLPNIGVNFLFDFISPSTFSLTFYIIL